MIGVLLREAPHPAEVAWVMSSVIAAYVPTQA